MSKKEDKRKGHGGTGPGGCGCDCCRGCCDCCKKKPAADWRTFFLLGPP